MHMTFPRFLAARTEPCRDTVLEVALAESWKSLASIGKAASSPAAPHSRNCRNTLFFSRSMLSWSMARRMSNSFLVTWVRTS